MVTAVKASGVAPPVIPPARSAGHVWPWHAVWPAILVVLAFVPLLVVHSRVLWARPHYKFFPLVIPGALALAWQFCRKLGPLEPGSRKVTRLLTGLGWALLALGVLFVSPSLGAVGALVTLGAAVYALGGPKLARRALPAWGFLWLAVPLPRRFDLMLVTGLQNLVSRWSSEFLDEIGVFHVMEGNVVEVAGRRLLVDQACSGIYSLLTLLLGTLFYALWTRSTVVRAVFLMAASVFWVVFGNVVRIVAVVVLSVRFKIDASAGLKHEALGLLIFALMLAMVASTDRLYSFAASVLAWARKRLSRPDPAGPVAPTALAPGDPELGPTELPDPRRTWVGSLAAASAFGLLLVPQWLMPGVDWKEVLTTNDVYAPLIGKLTEESMPKRWENYERLGFHSEHREMDDSWGENSRAWVYRQGTRGVQVSADYQFVDWHELTVCYQSQGWRMTGRRVGTLSGDDRPGGKYLVVADFVNPEGWYGHLIYGLYGRDGRPTPPPEALGFIQSMGGRLVSWFRGKAKEQETVARLNHQIQVFIESESPLSPADRESTLGFYDAMRGAIQREGLGVGAGPVAAGGTR